MKFENKEQSSYRKQLIVNLAAEGKTQSAIATLLRCDQSWVSKVLKQHQAEGDLSIQPKPEQRGKSCLLSSEDLKQLETFLLQGALKHDFETDNWTQERIVVLIKRQFGVSYHPSHISKLMQKIGFTVQKPQAQAYEQSAHEVQTWREKTLPDLKKSG